MVWLKLSRLHISYYIQEGSEPENQKITRLQRSRHTYIHI